MATPEGHKELIAVMQEPLARDARRHAAEQAAREAAADAEGRRRLLVEAASDPPARLRAESPPRELSMPRARHRVLNRKAAQLRRREAKRLAKRQLKWRSVQAVSNKRLAMAVEEC